MRSRRSLLVLLVIALLALGGALLIAQLRTTSPDDAVGTAVLPALSTHLNDVSEIRVLTAGNTPFVTLSRSPEGDHWQVAQRDGYRADFGKLREFLLKLSELKVVEVKTANPANYAQIGVEDVDGAGATGKRIEFAGLPSPLALILGKNSSFGGHYVRVAGAAQSYLAKPQITVYSDPQIWLDRSLMDTPVERVQEVRLVLAHGPAAERSYTVTRKVREQTDFTVEGLPRGRKLTYSGVANANAGTLAGLSFEDVRRAAPEQETAWKGAARAEYRLFDGTVITLGGRTEKAGDAAEEFAPDRHYVRIEVSFDEAQYTRFHVELPAATTDDAADGKPDEPQVTAEEPGKPAFGADPAQVRAEVQALQEKLRGWVFELPAHKYEAIFRPLDQLLEKD